MSCILDSAVELLVTTRYTQIYTTFISFSIPNIYNLTPQKIKHFQKTTFYPHKPKTPHPPKPLIFLIKHTHTKNLTVSP